MTSRPCEKRWQSGVADDERRFRRREMAVNAGKLTEKAQDAIVAAQRLAEERHHTQLEPEHLLHALVTQEDGVVPAILGRLKVQPQTVIDQLEPALSGLARATGPIQLSMSNRFR